MCFQVSSQPFPGNIEGLSGLGHDNVFFTAEPPGEPGVISLSYQLTITFVCPDTTQLSQVVNQS